jgi:hypothetical protein
VSALPAEGQFLPEVEDVMRADPWNENFEMPWPSIKAVWERYWDHDKALLVEKSPPNLIRVPQIRDHFAPVSFLIMVRNPYAHCESLMRRNHWDAVTSAEFTVRCLRQQAVNAETLERSVRFTYEELVNRSTEVCAKIENLVPEIGRLDPNERIEGTRKDKLVDLNKEKLGALGPRNIKAITDVLAKNKDAIDFWGYTELEPTLAHGLSYAVRRTKENLTTARKQGRRAAGRLARRAGLRK